MLVIHNLESNSYLEGIITMTIILTDDDIITLIMLPINVTDIGMTTDVRLSQASNAH